MEDPETRIKELAYKKLMEEMEQSVSNSNTTSSNGNKSNWYNEFLWWCAGVNRNVLRQCPTEYAKYAGMGGTIFSTACMAALSGGYAISTVFDSNWLAVFFGLFWGFVIIFNLDRLIVNTMYSDGKVTISWKELWSGLPRIIMAIFLGIVISTPLELKIYEKSIKSEVEKMKEKELQEYIAKDEATLADKEIKRDEVFNRPLTDVETGNMEDVFNGVQNKKKELDTKRNQVIQKIRRLQIIRSRLSPIDNAEQYHKITSEIYALSIQRNSLSRQIDELDRQGSNVSVIRNDVIEKNRALRDKELAVLDKNIETLKAKIDSAKIVYAPKLSEKYDGLQGRMAAFESLKQPQPVADNVKKEPNWFSKFITWLIPQTTTAWAAWFISMLFIIIECTPTFMRMMVADGSYEEILESEKHKIRVLASKRISDINDEINTEVQISTQKNKERLEAETKANKILMEKIAAAQAELLQTAIEKWREEELAKINENPSAYIKTNNASV